MAKIIPLDQQQRLHLIEAEVDRLRAQVMQQSMLIDSLLVLLQRLTAPERAPIEYVNAARAIILEISAYCVVANALRDLYVEAERSAEWRSRLQ